jgi:hypothetical protein
VQGSFGSILTKPICPSMHARMRVTYGLEDNLEERRGEERRELVIHLLELVINRNQLPIQKQKGCQNPSSHVVIYGDMMSFVSILKLFMS